MRYRRNPRGNGLLLVGILAAGGYLAYQNNWLAGVGLPKGASVPTGNTGGAGHDCHVGDPCMTSPGGALTNIQPIQASGF